MRHVDHASGGAPVAETSSVQEPGESFHASAEDAALVKRLVDGVVVKFENPCR